ncbi:MAG: magnesium transporter [Candidatus Omnitrophica bacterium CG11_big_fil_rev_8_21_14_0_20_45_26]|uniref:Magnesium transporter MgtE n=1 Tax=Candidatus Abzuiibacterium crystallinum TaxID=1974748 RepID=A0A2H0LQ76_9BACT|nr:MAG: magnesium transporter [Candidatus Omnitrophica bacterium CG11_big_fil_rev_8_21_14_0_20_45_26]PIW63979.1 MAG: magnesium transporter [Candidatus Omnitrophica bacterium CG12_big_fil_rev_8_21_14_0_65_45_16]
MTTRDALIPIVRKYFEEDPLRAAHSLETLSEEEAISVLKTLAPTLISQAFPYLSLNYASSLLKDLPQDLRNEILDKLDPQQAASILSDLPQEGRAAVSETLSPHIKHKLQEYLNYPEDSAGRIMSTDYLALHTDLQVKDAIAKIRSMARRKNPESYGYVVDHENHLVGVLNMRDLLLAQSQATLDVVMRKDIFAVPFTMDREQVAEELSKRGFFAAPVVDNEKRLLGVIKAEHLLDDVQEEATEDFQKMFGAGGDERAFSPVGFSLKMRLPWLHVNLATAFLAAFVVACFEDIIAKLTILAVFLPVVAGQGGNAGAQSLAVVIRGLVMREIPPKKAAQLILKEAWLGTVGGVATGLVTALVAWWWAGNPMLGVVIGLAMIVNLSIAGFAGAAIPIVMKRIGLDPAQCSNIILTTVTDVMGFFSFLGLAVLFESYLI